MLLSLPLLAPEVPASIVFAPASERHLRLALAMSRLGMIADSDLAALRRKDLGSSALCSLIENGWQRAVAGDYTFTLISAFARLILPHHTCEEDFTSAEGESLVGVAINARHPEWIVIGKAFSAVEALQTGLGRKALCILESTLCRFSMPHTAGGAYQLAQQLYWMGENDETLVLEEYGDEADVPRRADLFDGVPEWAYVDYSRPPIPMASDEEFAAAAEQYALHPVGPLIKTLQHLNSLEANDGLFADPYRYLDGEPAYPNEPPIVCGWNGEADFDQIFDDNYRYFSESCDELPPWIGCVMFVPSEQGISEALPRIRHTGLVLRALDSALDTCRDLNRVL